jgi:hypothetical protein
MRDGLAAPDRDKGGRILQLPRHNLSRLQYPTLGRASFDARCRPIDESADLERQEPLFRRADRNNRERLCP